MTSFVCSDTKFRMYIKLRPALGLWLREPWSLKSITLLLFGYSRTYGTMIPFHFHLQRVKQLEVDRSRIFLLFFRTNRRSQCYLLRHAHAWAYGTSRRGKQGDVSPQWAPCWHDRLARRPWDPWRSAIQVRRVCLPACLRSMIRLLVAGAGQWLSQAIASLQYRSFLALRTCCIGGGRRGGLGEWERWIGHFCRSF